MIPFRLTSIGLIPGIVVTALILGSAPLTAMAAQTSTTDLFPQAVPDEVLAKQRGGFLGPDGILLAFGLEQTTRINGELVHHTELRLPDAASSDLLRGQRLVIRNGMDGVELDHQPGMNSWVTGIQNTLDGQTIEHTTNLNLEIDDINMPRSDLSRALERQIIDGALGY